MASLIEEFISDGGTILREYYGRSSPLYGFPYASDDAAWDGGVEQVT